jgi:UDP-N-acetylglucosamine 2-epimerase (non-hydrolysing)
MQKKILCVLGTRPEAIKFSPLISCLRKNTNFQVVVCVTGQHREMLDQVLHVFGLKPDHHLKLMTHNQSLTGLTANMLELLSPILSTERPDCVVVQGDTTTAMVAGLASFYEKIPVVHLEAGLRSHDMLKPWPEEGNRKIIASFSSLHLAPTQKAKQNLIREGVNPSTIHVTGNTVIDALFEIKKTMRSSGKLVNALEKKFSFLKKDKPFILLTGHRRESIGQQQEQIFEAIKELVARHEIQVIYPVHLNPKVSSMAKQVLDGVENVFLIEPVDYVEIVYLLSKCLFVISDSGGIQEEAPSFGKPVLVTREVTERAEGIEAGSARLVGTNKKRIVEEASRLIEDNAHYQSMSNVVNPYGDGVASERICAIFEKLYAKSEKEVGGG